MPQSYDFDAPVHNSENIGLEPVWPYSLIGDAGPLHATAVRTYRSRTNKFNNDWSWDPLQAARLGLAEEVESALLKLTEKYQAYPNGLAQFAGPEFYVEQVGVLAASLQEALAQDYDGLLRIAPAWPKNWDVDGAVWIRGRSKVDVAVRNGVPSAIVLEAGTSGQMNLRNPWSGEFVTVVSGQNGSPIARGNGATLEFTVEAGQDYLIQRSATTTVKVSGMPAEKPKTLGTRHIGLLRE